jgi:hypothetical protein
MAAEMVPITILVDKKFAEIIDQLLLIHNKGVKCALSINFSGNPDIFTFRYTNIDPTELHEMVKELQQQKTEREIQLVTNQSTGQH